MGSWLTPVTDGPPLDEPSAVAYSEQIVYPQKGPPTGSVKLRCAWDQAPGVAANLLENYHVWPYPGAVDMLAQSATIKPKQAVKTGRDGSINTYLVAEIDVQYGYILLSPGKGDPVTESITPSGEMIKLKAKDKNGKFIFSVGGSDPQDSDWLTSEEGGPTKLVIGFDYNIKWDKYTGSFPPELLTMIDHVNEDSVTSPSLGLTFAAETLLLTATGISITFAPSGITKSLSLNYSWRQHGWNKFWRPRDQTWQSLYIWSWPTFAPVEYKNFPTGDFGPITL